MKRFIGDSRITEIEAQILYDLVIKHKPNKIVEIGTYSGYATIFLANAFHSYNPDEFIVSVSKQSNLNPEINLNNNDVKNVILLKNDDVLKVIKENVQNVDFIFIDDLHKEIEEVWEELKSILSNDCTLIFHDVLCEPTDEMKVPKMFSKINDYETEIIQTQDDLGNLNGVGIVYFKPKKLVIDYNSKSMEGIGQQNCEFVEESIDENGNNVLKISSSGNVGLQTEYPKEVLIVEQRESGISEKSPEKTLDVSSKNISEMIDPNQNLSVTSDTTEKSKKRRKRRTKKQIEEDKKKQNDNE